MALTTCTVLSCSSKMLRKLYCHKNLVLKTVIWAGNVSVIAQIQSKLYVHFSLQKVVMYFEKYQHRSYIKIWIDIKNFKTIVLSVDHQ